MRTTSATLRAFAQNSIDFFPREKPERIMAVRTDPTICHGKGHHAESVRSEVQVALANVQPLSTMDIFQQRASRGGVVPGLAAKLPWSTSPQSPALDRLLLCSEKQPVREDQILCCIDGRVVNYSTCGRNIVQQKTRLWKGQSNYGDAMFGSSTLGLRTSAKLGRYCDRRICAGEVIE